MSKIVIYGRSGCANCESAKLKCYRAKKEYEYLMLDDHLDELKSKFEQLPRSLPYIVYMDNLYTYNELDNILK